MGTSAGASRGSSRAVAAFRGVVAVGTSSSIVGLLMPRGLSADGHPSGSAANRASCCLAAALVTCTALCLKAVLSSDHKCGLLPLVAQTECAMRCSRQLHTPPQHAKYRAVHSVCVMLTCACSATVPNVASACSIAVSVEAKAGSVAWQAGQGGAVGGA